MKKTNELENKRKILFQSIPILSIIVTFGVYQYFNSVLRIDSILIALFVFNMMQEPIQSLPQLYLQIMSFMVSMSRIEVMKIFYNIGKIKISIEYFLYLTKKININIKKAFLREDQFRLENLEKKENPNFAIIIDNLNFSWGKTIEQRRIVMNPKIQVNSKPKALPAAANKSMQKPTQPQPKPNNLLMEPKLNPTTRADDEKNKSVLKNLKIKIKKGEFIGVFGEVGSGKSSLIQAIMNNLIIIENENMDEKEKKKILVNGDISYTAQNPWIFNETIKNNILFFTEYDHKKYKETIRLCQLTNDIEGFPGKDMTEIGEKAINLSGGQKARLSLARAVYSDKEIFLLDDPLAALDKEVGEKIFFDCFMEHLDKRTRILATHNLKYLPNFDRIIWMNRGEIIFFGKFAQLEKKDFFIDFTHELVYIHYMGNFKKKEEEQKKNIIENFLDYVDNKNNEDNKSNKTKKNTKSFNENDSMKSVSEIDDEEDDDGDDILNKGNYQIVNININRPLKTEQEEEDETEDEQEIENPKINEEPAPPTEIQKIKSSNSLALIDAFIETAFNNAESHKINKDTNVANKNSESNSKLNVKTKQKIQSALSIIYIDPVSNKDDNKIKEEAKENLIETYKENKNELLEDAKENQLNTFKNMPINANRRRSLLGIKFKEIEKTKETKTEENIEQKPINAIRRKSLLGIMYNEKHQEIKANALRRKSVLSIMLKETKESHEKLHNKLLDMETNNEEKIQIQVDNNQNPKDFQEAARKKKSTLSIRFIDKNENNPETLIKEKEQQIINKILSTNKDNKVNRDIVQQQTLSTNINPELNTNANTKDSAVLAVHRLIVDEDQEKGDIKKEVYIEYFNYMGGKKFFIVVLIVMFLCQALSILGNIWLANWTRVLNMERRINWYYLIVYSVFSLGSCIVMYIQLWNLSVANLNCALILHTDMINKLIKAPINLFHEITTKGQILNRLSTDSEKLLNSMNILESLFASIFSMLGSLFVIGYYKTVVLLFFPVLARIAYSVFMTYSDPNKDLIRLDAIYRSKVLNIFSEAVGGVTSIRVFNREQEYKNKFYKIIDDSMKIKFFSAGCFCWYKLFMDLANLSFFAVLLVSIIIFESTFDPQSILLIILYFTRLQTIIINIFLITVIFQNYMISMERCLKIIQVPQEKPSKVEIDKHLIDEATAKKQGSENIINVYNPQDLNKVYKFDSTKIKKIWPKNGRIEFKNYTVQYRPGTPIVLNDLSFFVNPGEKVGIIGRTGCGKSTICNSLFRILEPIAGTIVIDGEDVTKIGLQKLRTSLTIIPQDPFIFSGTLKFNIDPYNIYKAEDILSVLDMVGYNYKSDPAGINKIIGDENKLSVGEKQLVCIARAVLRVTYLIIFFFFFNLIEFENHCYG